MIVTALEVGQKKYLQIAERILRGITDGTYKEGEMIPTVRELAKQFGVNPQTVNKATAHLASLGYLHSRQGAGSEVIIPESTHRDGIYMLIDQNRSRYLDDVDDPRNYHGKDLYLTYLMRMSQERRSSRFLVYGYEDTKPRAEVQNAIGEVAGFLVQGTLPGVYVQLLEDSGVPTVLINRKLPDTVRGGRIASVIIGLDRLQALVDYFVTLGHRKLLYVRASEFELNTVYEERLAAVRASAQIWRNEVDVAVQEFVFTGTYAESLRCLENHLAAGFTAAVAYNDASALQFYSLIQRAGLTVGRDFSVGGFDDISAARLAIPALTTVRVDRGRLIREAFSLLDELSRSKIPTQIERTLDTELMIRRSAFPPRVAAK